MPKIHASCLYSTNFFTVHPFTPWPSLLYGICCDVYSSHGTTRGFDDFLLFDSFFIASITPEMSLQKGRRLHSGTASDTMDETDGIRSEIPRAT